MQSEYSLWTRDPEDEVLPTLRELGIGLVAYSPLGRGFLTGQIRSFEDLPEDDWRRSNPRFQEEALRENLELADRVADLAGRHDVTPAQLALAWVLARAMTLSRFQAQRARDGSMRTPLRPTWRSPRTRWRSWTPLSRPTPCAAAVIPTR